MQCDMRTKKKILNEKFKDSIPSDFEGEVWDKRLLEAMDEYAKEALDEALIRTRNCDNSPNKVYFNPDPINILKKELE